MEVIKLKNLTLNTNKCTFGSKKIKFQGTLFSFEGVKPDPEKNKVLEDLEQPKNKEELKSFVCTMQSSNSNVKSVIPVLEDTYNTFDNRHHQESDNSPSFNSKQMLNFASKRDRKQIKITPGHPSANNIETVMKPLGKDK